METWLILLIVVGLVVYCGYLYNRIIAMIEAVSNNEKQISIQLDRRYKVFESLIEVVKKYMDYEQSTLAQVVTLRNQAKQAEADGNIKARAEAENKISGVLGGISAVFEQYPDLKANQNAIQLQEEIVSTENKLAYAKQAYNDSIETYNAYKKSVPQTFLVSLLRNSLDQSFTYWSLTEEENQKKESYSVKL